MGNLPLCTPKCLLFVVSAVLISVLAVRSHVDLAAHADDLIVVVVIARNLKQMKFAAYLETLRADYESQN